MLLKQRKSQGLPYDMDIIQSANRCHLIQSQGGQGKYKDEQRRKTPGFTSNNWCE